MTPQEKKELSEALIEAMNREELHTCEVAKYLNLKSCYISMARSEKSWDAMGRAPWERLMEWLNTRCAIRDFQIPEGEEIVEQKKPVQIPAKTSPEEHSPEAVLTEYKDKKPKKERNIYKS
jgi:hypothetical protein